MLNFKHNRLVLYISAFFVVALVVYALVRDTAQVATLQQVQGLLNSGQVEKVIASEEYVYIKTETGVFKIATSQVSPGLFANSRVEIDTSSYIVIVLLVLVLILGIGSIAFRYWLKYRPQGSETPMSMARSNSSLTETVRPVASDVTFADIGGISDVKEELEEIIDFLKNPVRYRSFGARMPRGVLLVGPPGVGKTMIAKAVAAEAGVPFYYQSGASFVQIYVGMGAKRVHELFSAAKNNSPSIIFIDEIDAVGKERDGSRNDEREATLNQLLTEMDGFEDTSGVIVIAATNKIDVLDPALLRAGRFDRRIFVELPTPRERELIISKYLANIPHDVSSKEIAKMTVGFNGASLAALVNEAALYSLRRNEMRVTTEHFYAVKDKVAFGKKKLPILTERQKAYRARYLAGKAVVAYRFDLPFEKVMLSSDTIKPQMNEPMLKNEIEARIKVLLAGMAACELRFDEHASNATTDVQRAKELSERMLEQYAMGDTIIPLPEEKRSLLQNLYAETKVMLQGMSAAIDAVEAVLIEKESITKEQIKERMDAVL
jgi:cell division protease FtsH